MKIEAIDTKSQTVPKERQKPSSSNLNLPSLILKSPAPLPSSIELKKVTAQGTSEISVPLSVISPKNEESKQKSLEECKDKITYQILFQMDPENESYAPLAKTIQSKSLRYNAWERLKNANAQVAIKRACDFNLDIPLESLFESMNFEMLKNTLKVTYLPNTVKLSLQKFILKKDPVWVMGSIDHFITSFDEENRQIVQECITSYEFLLTSQKAEFSKTSQMPLISKTEAESKLEDETASEKDHFAELLALQLKPASPGYLLVVSHIVNEQIKKRLWLQLKVIDIKQAILCFPKFELKDTDCYEASLKEGLLKFPRLLENLLDREIKRDLLVLALDAWCSQVQPDEYQALGKVIIAKECILETSQLETYAAFLTKKMGYEGAYRHLKKNSKKLFPLVELHLVKLYPNKILRNISNRSLSLQFSESRSLLFEHMAKTCSLTSFFYIFHGVFVSSYQELTKGMNILLSKLSSEQILKEIQGFAKRDEYSYGWFSVTKTDYGQLDHMIMAMIYGLAEKDPTFVLKNLVTIKLFAARGYASFEKKYPMRREVGTESSEYLAIQNYCLENLLKQQGLKK